MRKVILIAAVAVSAGCATGAAYSPRPFPGAPAARSTAPAPAEAPAPSTRTAGPSVSSDRLALSSALMTTALGLRGIPYRLGGADLNGFDCSGLVQYVMRQHGIDMPRTVIDQFAIGDATSAIETGDLVFFQTIGSKASHVGIAIDAESFVHAPSSRGVVRVERLDAPYWSQRLLGARRVF